MLKSQSVRGFDALREALNSRGANTTAFVYFVADRDAETNRSWCPDCVASDPVVEEAIKAVKPKASSVLITCEVGDKPFWKNQANPFRTSEDLKVTSVPTLLCYGKEKRLVVNDCKDATKIKAFLEE
ncbi:thioredoxin domain-containing protein 17-like [Tropilaelaps mercedesae]|uniref:Thioredoxin domain-containing protein 17 n=1 Tax=Tropilaelaps mercedesae TaxID=418985 RepID=A0A1V9XD95_9ACAR|nr:thioredoxin domain-containing protein 17-like [Tropilaelaps mercedesae]